jgi:hypothetical protein
MQKCRHYDPEGWGGVVETVQGTGEEQNPRQATAPQFSLTFSKEPWVLCP